MKQATIPFDLTVTDEAVLRIGSAPEAVLPILQALQDHYGYLPEEALKRVCEKTQITPASIAGVASFYDMFRHKPAGKHLVRVCRGTACHVNGAGRVEDALRRELNLEKGEDTDHAGRFTVEQVACLGCCTLAPVVRIGHSTFGHSTAEKVPGILREFSRKARALGVTHVDDEHSPGDGRAQITIGLGSCCMAKGSDDLFRALRDSVSKSGVKVTVKGVGCVGMCHRTPLIEVTVPGKTRTIYSSLELTQARHLVNRHFRSRSLVQRAAGLWTRVVDTLLDNQDQVAKCELSPREPEVGAFLGKQVHIATEHFGELTPLDLDEYVAHDGFQALARCLGVAWLNSRDVRQPGARSAGFQTCRIADFPVGRASKGDGSAGLETRDTAGLETCATSPYFCPPALSVPGTQSTQSGQPAASPALSPEQVIEMISASGLRGRGGAGFSTGDKWRMARKQPGPDKYVICNGDEGDPGAFMDRMLLESFPFRIIEGLAIAAVSIGAHEGIFYIRHEYPLAVKRINAALKICQQRGWLGESLLGSGYALRFTIQQGAGAFVCGEETALLASLEGGRGMPRLRPPYPIEQGLWGKPTVINNVETLAVVPWIIRNGAKAFAAYGTATSKGTKVFALAGNVVRGGLIEIPMGMSLREIVEEIGGGVRPGRKFKAVQIGGPSGGCVPARLADTPVDFESLREVGAIMGSGGLVVLDDSACMVDIARYFLDFTQKQSCGKCTFCRIGTRRMLEILERLCAGKGQPRDLAELEGLANQVGAGSLCGLGKTAPNPVLTTLRYFRDEYEAHLQGRCPAGKCPALIKYRVLENCTGCTLCAQRCPVDAIPMTPYARHVIDSEKCTCCDSCRQVCPYDAIEVK